MTNLDLEFNDNSFEIELGRRHEYDIDAFEILDKLRVQYSKHEWPSTLQKDKILNDLNDNEEELIKIESENGNDLTKNIQLRNYILPFSSDNYERYLGWKILTMEPYKIGAMLTWQYEKHKKKKQHKIENFVEFIEFRVYHFVNDHNFLSEDIRLEKITNWVAAQVLPNEIDDPIIKISTKIFRRKLCKNLLNEKLSFFPLEADHSKLKELIVNGVETNEIHFNGNKNQLPEFFKRLHDRKDIVVDNKKNFAKWIVNNFVVILKNGNTEKLSFDSVWKILKSKKISINPQKRILIDKYPPRAPISIK